MLEDDIHRALPLHKRVADSLAGRAVSHAKAELVGAARLLEQEARMGVARRSWALQATLVARSEEIGAPPADLPFDLDQLVYAATALSTADRPEETRDPDGYAAWSRAFAAQTKGTSALLDATAQEVRDGRYDEDLRVGLGADGLMSLLQQELRRHQPKPELSELEQAYAAPAHERQQDPTPEL